jgi:hypothetical protein
MRVHLQWYQDAKTQTVDTLPEFVRHLTDDYEHDYGTICHAITAAALAAAHAVDHSSSGGITGFQAGAIMWEFIQEWQDLWDQPLRLVHYEHMLYPQYDRDFAQLITPSTWRWLQEQATKHLRESGGSVSVRQHWESIVAGVVPFGFFVAEEE